MKRRDFLASAAALSLFASEAWAAKEDPAKPASGAKPAAPRAKAGSKPNARNVNANSARGLRGKQPVTYKPQQSVVHTADDPVIERPPQGTSASRLPPVKAPNRPVNGVPTKSPPLFNLKGKSGPTRFWLPLPLNQDTLYQRTLGHSWTGNPANAGMRRLPDGDLEVFHCEWPDAGDAQAAIDDPGHAPPTAISTLRSARSPRNGKTSCAATCRPPR